MDYHIQPLSKKVKSYIKDTNDFLRKIKNLPPLPEGALLCTIDVVGLYPNIPHDYGLAALRKALDTREDQNISTDSLTELAKLALKNNFFEHNLRIFKQEQGTAIGAKFAPSYAIVVLDDFEKDAIDGFHLKPWVWWRYIDDVFFIWDHDEESLKEFLAYLNTLHPNIKFDSPAQYSSDTLNFLDVTVSRVGDRLKTDLYSKATDTHQFLEFSSCHPFHTKRSIPYSQTLRLRRICSEDRDFYKRIKELKGYLKARGYDMSMVEKQVLEAMKKSREEALRDDENRNNQNENRDVFVSTYHPALSAKVFKIFKDNHSVLTSREDHREVFSDVPMISFRRTKSLQDILVRALIKTSSNETNECRGCNGRSDCEVCGILKKGSKFSNMDGSKTFDIRKGTLHCNTEMCVYLMSCNICNKQYVGKCKPKFRSRYNNYKTKFRKYYQALKEGKLNTIDPIPQAHLYQHFADHLGDNFKVGTDEEDFSFWSFQIIDKSPNEEKLLERENFWVYKLRTMKADGGLNERDVPVIGRQRSKNQKEPRRTQRV